MASETRERAQREREYIDSAGIGNKNVAHSREDSHGQRELTRETPTKHASEATSTQTTKKARTDREIQSRGTSADHASETQTRDTKHEKHEKQTKHVAGTQISRVRPVRLVFNRVNAKQIRLSRETYFGTHARSRLPGRTLSSLRCHRPDYEKWRWSSSNLRD